MAGVENANYVGQLNAVNPTAADFISQGDDHLRLLKATLLATFPGFSRPIDGALFRWKNDPLAITVYAKFMEEDGRLGVIEDFISPANAAGAILRANNNLSDVQDPAIARANLGVTAMTDVLLRTNNLGDVQNAALARANLGVPEAGTLLEKVQNLADLPDKALARSNLEAAASVDVLQKASNLSDVPNKAAARANLDVMSTSAVADAIAAAQWGGMPYATAFTLGGIKLGDGLVYNGVTDRVDTVMQEAPEDGKQYARKDGAWEEVEDYTLPTASDSVLGGVKVGDGLAIDGEGILRRDESLVVLTSTSGVFTVDLDLARSFYLELTENITSWTWLNAPSAGELFDCLILIKQHSSSSKSCANPATVALRGWSMPTALGRAVELRLVITASARYMEPSLEYLPPDSNLLQISSTGSYSPSGLTELIVIAVGSFGTLTINSPTSTPHVGHTLTVISGLTGGGTLIWGPAYQDNLSYLLPKTVERFVLRFVWSGTAYVAENADSRLKIESSSYLVLQAIGASSDTPYISLNGSGTRLSAGNYNLALGQNVQGGYISSVGEGWVALGYQAGPGFAVSNTNFVCVGDMTSARRNGVAVGHVTTCMSNSVAVGSNIATGHYCTVVGAVAGVNWTNSNANNTALGYKCLDTSTTSWTNTTGLGYNAQVTGSDQLQLGDTSTAVYSQSAVNVRSDIRDKADVRDTELGLDFILGLRPVQYRLDPRDRYRPAAPESNLPAYTEPVVEEGKEPFTQEELDAHRKDWEEKVFAPAKEADRLAQEAWSESCRLANIVHDGTHKGSRFHNGFIAHEVKELADSLGKDFAGYQDHSINGGEEVKSLGYEQFIAPMVKALQELKAQNDALLARIEVLESK